MLTAASFPSTITPFLTFLCRIGQSSGRNSVGALQQTLLWMSRTFIATSLLVVSAPLYFVLSLMIVPWQSCCSLSLPSIAIVGVATDVACCLIHYMAILHIRFPLCNTKALLVIHTTVAIQVGEGHIIMSRGHCAWDIHVMHSSQVESVQVS